MSAAAQVLRGYRRLLRARLTLFQNDEVALRESKVKLREAFEANRQERDPARLEELLQDIADTEDMMLNHLAQGKLNQRGNYEVELKPIKEDPESSCPPKFEPAPIDTAEIERRERELKNKTGMT